MRRHMWLPIALLVLSSLACSIFGRAGEAIDAGREAATLVAEVGSEIGEEGLATLVPEEPDEEPGDDEPAQPEVDVDALQELQSYRMRMTTEWIPEEGEVDYLQMEQAQIREPRAQRTVWRDAAGESAVEFVEIGEQAWMCSGGACTHTEADPDEIGSEFSDPGMFNFGFLTDDVYDSLLGREQVNGIQTRHYDLRLSAMQAAFLAQGDVSDLSGEVWIADEPDLPAFTVRLEMSWTEERQERTGQASIEYEVYDVNEPFTIEPPEGADRTGLPDDVPPYPGGEQEFSMEGMAGFSTTDSPAEVAEFYREALAEEGWTLQADDEMGDMIQQSWTKEATSLMVMITAQDEETGIMITIEGAR